MQTALDRFKLSHIQVNSHGLVGVGIRISSRVRGDKERGGGGAAVAAVVVTDVVRIPCCSITGGPTVAVGTIEKKE